MNLLKEMIYISIKYILLDENVLKKQIKTRTDSSTFDISRVIHIFDKYIIRKVINNEEKIVFKYNK
jgi:hypothetical protein